MREKERKAEPTALEGAYTAPGHGDLFRFAGWVFPNVRISGRERNKSMLWVAGYWELIVMGGIQMQEDRISVDLDSIPESVRMQLVAAVCEAAKEYIQQPGIREKFERWREQRDAKKSATQGQE